MRHGVIGRPVRLTVRSPMGTKPESQLSYDTCGFLHPHGPLPS